VHLMLSSKLVLGRAASTSFLRSSSVLRHLNCATLSSHIFLNSVSSFRSSHSGRMACEAINLSHLVSACIDSAQRAGAIIRKVWKSGDLDVKDKGNDDPMTHADTSSQKLIIGLLHAQWPSLMCVGEEDVECPTLSEKPRLDLVERAGVTLPPSLLELPASELCLFIDPLDATKEFTLGNLEAVITLIGIAYHDTPIAGVMYQPFVGEGVTVWGIEGVGSFGYTKRPRKEGGLILTTTRTHGTPEVEKSIELIKPEKVLRVGGAGYKALMILEDIADVYVFPQMGTKKWDTCAPEAIVRAAGGILTDVRGNKLVYNATENVHNRFGVLCTMRDHSKYVNALRSL